MKSVTTASCFTTYMLPHILFVDGFAERQHVVMICCLAWNISIFSDKQQRNQHIDMVWDMGLNNNPNKATRYARASGLLRLQAAISTDCHGKSGLGLKGQRAAVLQHIRNGAALLAT
jgi:hypothetical protein